MTLLEMSLEYAHSADLLRERIRWLRREIRESEDPEARRALRQRMYQLDPLLREARALQKRTAHYYDRGPQ